MSDSRRARTIRRLTGGVLIALSIGLAIERAGAQQQGSASANVNVISGTGADGDWTLQRQNEPSMACSSRNPQNCLAGANDYRTVDIPLPGSGEKSHRRRVAWLVHDEERRPDVAHAPATRLSAGRVRRGARLAAQGVRGRRGSRSFDREPTASSTTAASRSTVRRAVAARSSWRGSSTTTTRKERPAKPIDYLGASIVHRIGPVPTVLARRQGREGRPASTAAARRPAPAANSRAAGVRAGVEQPGAITQLVDKPWIAVDVPRAGAQMCSIGGPGTGVPLQTFPGGRVYMAYALFDDPGEQRGRIMFSSSANCGATWSAPRVLSRVQSADVNDDGVANATDVTRCQAQRSDELRACRVPTQRRLQQRLQGQRRRSRRSSAEPSASPSRSSPGSPRAPPSPSIPRRARSRSRGVSSTTASCQTPSSPCAPPTAAAPSRRPESSPNVSPFEQGTTVTSFRTNAFPTMAIDGAGQRVPRVVGARIRGGPAQPD